MEKMPEVVEIQAGSNLPEKYENAKPGEHASAKSENVSAPTLAAGSFSTYYTWRGSGTVRLNCGNAGINSNSRVFVSISEYNTDPRLNRFMGDATMSVYNVSPYNGGFIARLNVNWSGPLNVRIDVLVDP